MIFLLRNGFNFDSLVIDTRGIFKDRQVSKSIQALKKMADDQNRVLTRDVIEIFQKFISLIAK